MDGAGGRLDRRRIAGDSQRRRRCGGRHRPRRRTELVPEHVVDRDRRATGDARPAADAVSPHPSPLPGRARREANRRSHRTRHQGHRERPGLRHVGAPRHRDQRADAGRHRRGDAVPELAVHAHLAVGRAGAVPGGVCLHAAHQARLAGRPEEGKRAGVDGGGGLLLDSRGQGLRARRLRGAAVRAPEPRERRDRAAGPQHQDAALPGRRDHRGHRHLPDALVRRAAGPGRGADAPGRWSSSCSTSGRCTSRCATCRR